MNQQGKNSKKNNEITIEAKFNKYIAIGNVRQIATDSCTDLTSIFKNKTEYF